MSEAIGPDQLSIVIPSYRRPNRLAKVLASLAGQPEALRAEVVVCDDGSPAEDGAAYERVAAESGLNVTLVRRENGGPGAARNTAGRAATRPLLLFIDDDCVAAGGLIERHLQGSRPGTAVEGQVALQPDARLTPFMEMVMRGAQYNFVGIADPERVPFTCFYFANCSVWKEDLERAGWFDPAFRLLEDAELAYRLQRTGTRLTYRAEALVYHEHALELDSYLRSKREAGRIAVDVVEKHPELFDALGLRQVADAGVRERYYATVLQYAFICGVEDGLQARVATGAMTGTELRGQLERWIASWAARQAGEIRAWRRRAEALEAEVQRRDARLAQVVQEKDDRIASLEAQLTRFNALLPVRIYQRLAARRRRT